MTPIPTIRFRVQAEKRPGHAFGTGRSSDSHISQSASPPPSLPQALDTEAANEIDNDAASLIIRAPRPPSPFDNEPILKEPTIWVAGSLAPWEPEHHEPEASDLELDRWATSTPRRRGRALSPLPHLARKRQQRDSASPSVSSIDDEGASVHALAPGSPQAPSSPQSPTRTRSTSEVDPPPSDPHSHNVNDPCVLPNTSDEDKHDQHDKGGAACCGDLEDASDVDKASASNALPQDMSGTTSNAPPLYATDEDATYVEDGRNDDDEMFDDEFEDEDLLDAAYEDRHEEEGVLEEDDFEDASGVCADEDEPHNVTTSSCCTRSLERGQERWNSVD